MIWQATFADRDMPQMHVQANTEQEARFAINTYFREVLKRPPPVYVCVQFLPMLRTDGRHVDVLAADNSGEYVGVR